METTVIYELTRKVEFVDKNKRLKLLCTLNKDEWELLETILDRTSDVFYFSSKEEAEERQQAWIKSDRMCLDHQTTDFRVQTIKSDAYDLPTYTYITIEGYLNYGNLLAIISHTIRERLVFIKDEG